MGLKLRDVAFGGAGATLLRRLHGAAQAFGSRWLVTEGVQCHSWPFTSRCDGVSEVGEGQARVAWPAGREELGSYLCGMPTFEGSHQGTWVAWLWHAI